MTSVPVRNSGLGSAINNAISRVGPQLAGALIFVFLTATFYGYLASRGLPVNDESFRSNVSPLNTPPVQNLVAVVREASTSSFHLAMLIGAGLLLAGAVVNGVGIRNNAGRPADIESATGEPAAAPA